MKLFFAHSSMQLSIVCRIVNSSDIVVCHRGLDVRSNNPKLKNIIFFEDFALSGGDNIRKLLKLINRSKCSEIVFPHSHKLNKLFPFVYYLEPKIRISYIEDGALTWRFLNSPKKDHNKFKPLNRFIFFVMRFLYKVCIWFPSAISINCIKFLLGKMQACIDDCDYIFRNTEDGIIYTSYNIVTKYNHFVDVTPKNLEVTNDLIASSAFFISPRYLLTDQKKLLNLLLDQVGNARLVLVVHPTFWKKSKENLLQKFILRLSNLQINNEILVRTFQDLDVTFELYMRGCRKFMFIDTSSEITVNTNKHFFAGLEVKNLQKEVYGKSTMLNELNIKESTYFIGSE